MELDFSKLDKLSFLDFVEVEEKEPSKMPSETILEQEEYKAPLIDKNALQGQLDSLQGIPILQRKADANEAEKERAREVYREYQNNIKLSSQLQTEILKGVKQGEDIYSLFLKAVQAISLMTSNKVFYSQTQNDLRAIYGAGLLEPKLLEMELEEVQERLERLREARKRNTEPADSLKRIDNAIKAHEKRITILKDMIDKGGESLTA